MFSIISSIAIAMAYILQYISPISVKQLERLKNKTCFPKLALLLLLWPIYCKMLTCLFCLFCLGALDGHPDSEQVALVLCPLMYLGMENVNSQRLTRIVPHNSKQIANKTRNTNFGPIPLLGFYHICITKCWLGSIRIGFALLNAS